ncbi:hypothetical protein Btru_031748 [Bulinus truncatus]|nr:hypothetical protein Btru_031748 [Bulinus truncatus]
MSLIEAVNFTTPRLMTSDVSLVSTEDALLASAYFPPKNVSVYRARELIASCRHSCQSNMSIPCACDVKCLVYNNCCEDFIRECPENFAESKVKYKFFFGLETECTASNFIVISSCSKNSAIKNVNMTFELNPNLVLNDYFAFSETLPVTDLETSLSYKNRTVFLCNAMGDPNPLKWNVLLDNLDINNIQSMNEITSRSEKHYFSPPTDISSPKCPSKSINSCGKSPFQNLCKSFKSFISSSYNSVFDNVYCALCNGKEENGLSLLNEKSVLKNELNFNLLMSVKERSILFTSTSKRDMWKHAECYVETGNEEKPDTGKLVCLATACEDVPVKHLHGKCQILHELVLASDYHEMFRHHRNASDFTRCFLEVSAGVDIAQEVEPASFCYSPEMSIYVYVLRFIIYDTSEFLAWNINKKLGLLTNFTSILKILRAHFRFENSTFQLPPANSQSLIDLQMMPRIARYSHLFLSEKDDNTRKVKLCACSYDLKSGYDMDASACESECVANCVRADVTSLQDGFNQRGYHKCKHFLKSPSCVGLPCLQLCHFLLANVALNFLIDTEFMSGSLQFTDTEFMSGSLKFTATELINGSFQFTDTELMSGSLFTDTGLINRSFHFKIEFMSGSLKFTATELINGSFQFTDTEFMSGSLQFTDTEFMSGCLQFTDTEFMSGSLKFTATELINGSFQFTDTELMSGSLKFTDTGLINGSFQFTDTEFMSGSLKFTATELINGSFQFTDTEFMSGSLQFTDTEFMSGSLQFTDTEFMSGSLKFTATELINGSFQFTDTELMSGSLKFTDTGLINGSFQFTDTEFMSGSLKFTATELINGSFQFTDTELMSGSLKFTDTGLINGFFQFTDTELMSGSLKFTATELINGSFQFTDTEFMSGSLQFTDTEFMSGSLQFTDTEFMSGSLKFTATELINGSFQFTDTELMSGSLKFTDTGFGNHRFENRRFRNHRFENRRFENRRFENCRFENRRFGNRRFENRRFGNRRFGNADLETADLKTADLKIKDLKTADLKTADLETADLETADLKTADLETADLETTDLKTADLKTTDLKTADLKTADLETADLETADLKTADLKTADLETADLETADLKTADLETADLKTADLETTDLKTADLETADLKTADLELQI